MTKKSIFFILIIFNLLFLGCQNKPNDTLLTEGKWDKLTAIRLEESFINNNASAVHEKWKHYPELYTDFYTKMLNMGIEEELNNDSLINTYVIPNLNLYITDSNMRYIFNSIQNEFPDFSYYETEISKGLNRFDHLFNVKTKIGLGTFNSNFNATVIENDQIIWIGLDMYLGVNHPIIKLLPNEAIPQYYKNKMDKKYIVSDAMFGFLMGRIYEPIGDELLSKMLAYGKIAYVIDLILPMEERENTFRYTRAELDWCENHEEEIWKTLVDNSLLYEKDPSKTNPFFSDGPYTKNFGKESPSNIGIWIGYKIIKDYVNHNKISTQEINKIISEKDIQKLLRTYDPN